MRSYSKLLNYINFESSPCFQQIGRCAITWRRSDPLPILINRRVLTLGVKMPPWLTKTLIVVHLNPEMPLNMARDFVAKLHHHAPLYNERAQGYTSVWQGLVCVYRQCRFVNKSSKCSVYFFKDLRSFRFLRWIIFIMHARIQFFFLGRGVRVIFEFARGIQGIFSEILLFEFKKIKFSSGRGALDPRM